MVKASTSNVGDCGLGHNTVKIVTEKLALLCTPCHVPSVMGSSSSCAFPAMSLGFTILGEIFLCT